MTDFQNTQGIIFVVDSNDRERITEAREECKLDFSRLWDKKADETVQRMLSEDELRDALLLVFANKQVGPFLLLHHQCLQLCGTCRLLSNPLQVEWSTDMTVVFRQSAQLVKPRAGGNNLCDATGAREAKVAGRLYCSILSLEHPSPMPRKDTCRTNAYLVADYPTLQITALT